MNQGRHEHERHGRGRHEHERRECGLRAPILWSELTVDLGSIALHPSAGFSVNFVGAPPRGSLISLNEIFYEDIVPAGVGGAESGSHYCPACTYVTQKSANAWPDSWTVVQQTWQITSTGAGTLELSLDFRWVFASLPGYRPDGIAGGPDNFLLDVLVNDTNMAHQQTNTGVPAVLGTSLSSRTVAFAAGELSTLTIVASTNANGGWIEKPPAPHW